MRIFIDSSIFLKLLLDEHGADKAQEILEMVEEEFDKWYGMVEEFIKSLEHETKKKQ